MRAGLSVAVKPDLRNFFKNGQMKTDGSVPLACAAACTGGQCLVANWLFRREQAAADWSPVKHLYP